MNITNTKHATRHGLKRLGYNKTELVWPNGIIVFYSYETPVVAYSPAQGEYLKTSTRFSKTTTRHIKEYLNGIEAREVPQSLLDKMGGLGS